MLGIEFIPSLDFDEDIANLKELLGLLEFDFIVIPDNPAEKITPNSLVCALKIENYLGIKTFPAIVGKNRSKEHLISMLYGAKYSGLSGVACVCGGKEISTMQMLQEAKKLNFDFIICTPYFLEEKLQNGANLCITQPIFNLNVIQTHAHIKVLPNFMPIFSKETLKTLQNKAPQLGFEIEIQSDDLFLHNQMLLKGLIKGDYYLSILNLKKQLPHLRKLYANLR